MSNTELWDSVCITDPKHTKGFKRKGGFSGTAIKPFWLIKRATEVFGPIGLGWGFKEIEREIAQGIWFSKVQLWYKYNDQIGTVEQWGATEFVGQNKSGPFIDEEAAKKSVTDAVTKCLSYIGFAGDVHMGLFDDSKYADPLADDPAPKSNPYTTGKAMQDRFKEIVDALQASGTWEELKAVWRANLTHIKAMKEMDNQFYIDLEKTKNDRKRAIEDHNVSVASYGQGFTEIGY